MRRCALLVVLTIACSDSNDPPATEGTPGTNLEGANCEKILDTLGTHRVAIGASMEDATATAAPFDARYIYISGGPAPGDAPCSSCQSSCSVNWWGCWQDTSLAPGNYVRDFVARVTADGQLPMLTWYQILHTSKVGEGQPEVNAIADDSIMRRYYADYKFFLQQIGNAKAIVHIEPDFWGYVAYYGGGDAHAVPAAVARVNNDCSGQSNDVAGFGRCLIAMARKYTPNALVGLHASAWGTQMDALMNASASFDVAAEARKQTPILIDVGAGGGDFIASDMSDRDAGYYESFGRDTWWNTNATLPNFTQAFTWGNAIAEGVGVPLIWWQIPVGNQSGNSVWEDNRVDYLFGHIDDVAASHTIALFFGAGQDDQTKPESDGNNLVQKVTAYAAGSSGALSCQ